MNATASFDDGTYATAAEPRSPDGSEGPAAPGAARVPTLSKEETARLGDEIYERDVRPQVEDAHYGEYVAIDVDSGAWALADDLLAAADLLRTQHPQAVDVWLVRIGYRAVHHFGGRPLHPAS